MLIKLRFLAIFASLLVLGAGSILGCLALSENYNYCVSHNGEHETGTLNPSGSPVIHGPIAGPTPSRLLVYCSGVFASDNGAGISAFGTVLLFIVTGLLGWIAYRQYTTTRAQLRAYIGVSFVDIVNPGEGLETKAVFAIENFGDTPAYEVRYLAGLAILPHPLPDNQTDIFVPHPDSPAPPNLTIYKGQKSPSEAFFESGSFSPNDFAKAMAGENERLYVAGIVTYCDAFGISRKTRFAFYIETGFFHVMQAKKPPSGKYPTGINTGKIDWIMSSAHNDAT